MTVAVSAPLAARSGEAAGALNMRVAVSKQVPADD